MKVLALWNNNIMNKEKINRIEMKNIKFLATFSILLFIVSFALSFKNGAFDISNFPFEIYLFFLSNRLPVFNVKFSPKVTS
jgi:hypothetical protein